MNPAHAMSSKALRYDRKAELGLRRGDQPVNPAHVMSSKALRYDHKAELGLRRGDLTRAVLQLKMAITSDPQSQLRRSALAEVQFEVAKKP